MRLAPIATAALFVFGLAQPSFAEMWYPATGGNGDIHNALVCPAGQYLKGIRGRAGAWIDQLAIMCAPLKAGNHVGGSTTYARAGGPGGAEQPKSLCEDSIIQRVQIYNTEDNRMVAHIDGDCASPDGVLTGKSVGLGASGWTSKHLYKQGCTPGKEGAVGFSVQWGEHVNAVGLICKDY